MDITTRRESGCLIVECTCGFAKCLPLDEWLSWSAAEAEAGKLKLAHRAEHEVPDLALVQA